MSKASNPSLQNVKVIRRKTKAEQFLEEYEGTIEENQQDAKKFTCLPCRNNKSPFYSGTWNNLQKHLVSSSHLKIIGEIDEESPKNSETGPRSDLNSPFQIKKQIEDQIVELTVNQEAHLNFLFTKFILQQRLPFASIQPLISFVKTLLDNYNGNCLNQYNSSRNTITRVTNNISESLKKSIFDQLKLSPFSLSVDAGSDSYGQSYFAICANFLEGRDPTKVSTKLVSILPIKESSTGETLHNKLVTTILNDPKIQANFMGISTDGGSNLAGPELGIQGRLAIEYPHMVFMRDFSHLYNNIFRKALKAFPENITKIITNICSHFEHSNQREALLKAIQVKQGASPLGILSLVPTRWLSMGLSLERILLLWDHLNVYFKDHGTNKERCFFTDENYTFLKVLSYLIEKLNSYNLYFQKENLFYDGVFGKIREGFVVFANMVVKKELKSLKFADHYSHPFEDLTLCIFHFLKILYPLCILNPYKYESNFLNSLLRLYVKVHINMNLTFQFFYRGRILQRGKKILPLCIFMILSQFYPFVCSDPYLYGSN